MKFEQAYKKAVIAINNEVDDAMDFAHNYGQMFDNVKHMEWFRCAYANFIMEEE